LIFNSFAVATAISYLHFSIIEVLTKVALYTLSSKRLLS
jgi:hypothetical protein